MIRAIYISQNLFKALAAVSQLSLRSSPAMTIRHLFTTKVLIRYPSPIAEVSLDGQIKFKGDILSKYIFYLG